MDKTLKNAVLVITLSLLLAALLPVLADQTRLLHGGYGSAAYAEETVSDAVCGTYFDAWVSELFSEDDPAETEYRWEAEEGSTGEVTEGIVTDNLWEEKDFRFKASKTGLVTIRFEAVCEGEVLRTVTKKYNVVEPYETYELLPGSIGAPEVGETFTITVYNWGDWENTIKTGEVQPPVKEDFGWSQEGEGKIKEVSAETSGYIQFTFEAVSAGEITLQFASRDGKWSQSIDFYVLANQEPSSQDDKPDRVVYGTYFDAFVGYELVKDRDPAGTEYLWEVEDGSVGSVEGGTITDQSMENNDFRFYAAKTGLVTVRFEAVYEGEILRTVTKKFNVVEPCETYYWVCSSMEAQDGGFSGGNDTSFDEIIKYNYISPGTTFTIDIHTWWEDERSYPTETTPKPTKDDFTFEQSGQGSVEEIESPGSSEAISFRFKCVNVGDMVLTLKAKDGSWSEDISFRVHADYMELPGILIRKSLVKDLKTSYSGGTIPFELTEEGDTPYKVKGMKRGKRFLLDKIVYAVSSDESIAVPGTCYWDVPIEYEGYDDVECSLPIRIIKAGTVKITIKDAKYNEALKSFEVNITDANVESYNKRWKNYASKTGLQYGETALVAWSGEGDKITINCAGVEQTKTVSAMEHVTFSDLPVMKTGTTGTVTYERFGDGLTVTKKFTVKDTKCYIVVSKVKTSSTKMTVKAKYAKAGDVIKIKAGGKTYTKKVTADNAYFKFTQKIKKQKKGAKIKVTVYNKFKQVRKTRTVKVTE